MTPLLLLLTALSFHAADSTRTAAPRSAPAAVGKVTMADSIVVEKSLRQLTLYFRGEPVKRYLVALGSNPVGAKVQQGDNRTPEGLYRIEARNPASKYHRALRVSYPNQQDRARAARLGVSPGGDIMIHGLPKAFSYVGAAHRLDDWTQGCIALTDEEIDEIYAAVPLGAAILIKP